MPNVEKIVEELTYADVEVIHLYADINGRAIFFEDIEKEIFDKVFVQRFAERTLYEGSDMKYNIDNNI